MRMETTDGLYISNICTRLPEQHEVCSKEYKAVTPFNQITHFVYWGVLFVHAALGYGLILGGQLNRNVGVRLKR